MNKNVLYSAFFLGFILTLIGALFKIQHWTNANLLLTLGLMATLLFIMLSLYEIFNSDRITKNEKVMWSVGFLFTGTITGIVYMTMGRKRIIK